MGARGGIGILSIYDSRQAPHCIDSQQIANNPPAAKSIMKQCQWHLFFENISGGIF